MGKNVWEEVVGVVKKNFVLWDWIYWNLLWYSSSGYEN